MKQWYFYILENNGCTYAGVSPEPYRRLRQHNQEIKGGAKYATSKSPEWRHLCIVEGFRTKIEAMQFEWAVKHAPPRNVGGIISRIRKMYTVCCREKWTSKAPLAREVPLTIHWHLPIADHPVNTLPSYVNEQVTRH
tara:strand:+ start:5428 stop:5838 length:411 start_codon:yes stop_codon:yes gene_type:complete